MGVVVGHGDLLTQDVEAYVNAVNTVGVMGAGLAAAFKRAWPAMYVDYRAACQRGELISGRVHVWENAALGPPRYIINVPTKVHYRSPSSLALIETGARALAKEIRDRKITSIAIPALGCGLGGLSWLDVEPILLREFVSLPDVDLRIFTPQNRPHPTDTNPRASS